MGFTTPLFLQAATGDPAIQYTANDYRQLIYAFDALDGVTKTTDLAVTQRGAGANMSVDVAAGQAAITGRSVANQGKYLAFNGATVNVAIAAAPGSNSRIDLIVARIYDNQVDGLGTYAATAEVVPGVVSASPVVTPVGAGTSWPSVIPLATVTVAAGQSSVVTANITDQRLLNTLGDKPEWTLTGGNGQSVPNNANTVYTGWTFSNYVGIGTNGNLGEVVVKQPGRYSGVLTLAINNPGAGTASSEMGIWVDHLNSSRTFIRRHGHMGVFTSATSGILTLSAPFDVRVGANEVLRGMMFNNRGANSNLNDANTVLRFSGSFKGQ